MDTRDVIYAQNWVEQFRNARRAFIGSDDYFLHEIMRVNPWEQQYPSVAIERAFTWSDTPEGDNVWWIRSEEIPRVNGEQHLIE